MSFLKASLLLLGVAVASCHRIQFRGGTSTKSFGSGLLTNPLFEQIPLNNYHVSGGELWDLDSTNPWAPKVVEVEVSHEIVHEPKTDVEFGGWKPIIPSWQKHNSKSVGVWKASDYKHKNLYNLKPKPMLNSDWKYQSWKEQHKPVVNKPTWSSPESFKKPYFNSKKYNWKYLNGDETTIDHESHDYINQDKGYKFNYEVDSSETGDVKSHEERKNDGVVEGKYTVKEADGSTREVHYTAGKDTGFKAVVVNHDHKLLADGQNWNIQHQVEQAYQRALSQQLMAKDNNPHQDFHLHHTFYQ